MKKAILALMALSTVALLAGCTGSGTPAREIKIVTTEMRFTPDVIQVKPGEKIKFVIENKGSQFHEFVSNDLKFEEVEVYPGETKSVVATMPKKAGEYTFICEAKGHHEAGMEGKVVVGE